MRGPSRQPEVKISERLAASHLSDQFESPCNIAAAQPRDLAMSLRLLSLSKPILKLASSKSGHMPGVIRTAWYAGRKGRIAQLRDSRVGDLVENRQSPFPQFGRRATV